MNEGIAQKECGTYGLKFQVTKKIEYIKVVSKTTLDRKNLGTAGKALYQADIYLPAEDNALPYSVAVLAVLQEPDGSSAKYRFYRFGVVNGTSVFFAYTYDEPSPILIKTTDIAELKLKRPGWHRFQIIFEGQENIICAIDGIATSFSPIQESSLGKLRAGLMVSSSKRDAGVCFTDNLSIQFTAESAGLPDSPWSFGSEKTGPPPGFFTLVSSSSETKNSISWLTSPEKAWEECCSQKRPLLTLFYAPRVQSCQSLMKILSADSSAQSLLGKFVLLHVDVNQLRGGSLAQQFGVFKVPCFVVIDNQAQTKAKEFYKKNTDWNTIASNLQKTISP